jgi:chromosome segregation ATPase
MAKRKGGGGGKVPQKVLDQRANAAGRGGSGGGADTDEILKRIEAEEAEAFRQFEAQQRERREKALGEVVKPLRDERDRLAQEVSEASARIGEIDRQVAKLLGKAEPKGRAAGSGGKRTRLTESQKSEAADAIAELVHKAGEQGVSKGQLQEKVSPFPSVTGSALASFVNDKASNGKRIKLQGSKAAARYVAV